MFIVVFPVDYYFYYLSYSWIYVFDEDGALYSADNLDRISFCLIKFDCECFEHTLVVVKLH